MVFPQSRRLVLGLLFAAGLPAVARAGGLACDWTGAASTAWADPANWSNCGGGVPGAGDTAAITDVPNQATVSTATPVGGLTLGTGTTLTIAASGNLSLDGPTFGAGNIVVDGILTWVAGAMGGTGVTTIQPGGTLSMFDVPSRILSRNIGVMPGGVTTGGDLTLIITDGVVFANSGLFHIQNGANITGAGSFENLPNGTFRSSPSGANNVLITLANWVNTGLVEVLMATLSFEAGTFVHGGTYLFDNTRVHFATGTHTVIGTFDGYHLEMSTPVTFLPPAQLTNTVELVEIRSAVTFDTGEELVFDTLLLETGPISGGDDITTTTFFWNSGTLTGTGIMTIPPGGDVTIFDASPRTLDRHFYNGGDAGVLAMGTLVIPPNRTFHNLPGAFFVLQQNGQVTGEGTLANTGTFVRAGALGGSLLDLDFQNAGIVILENGDTTVHEYHQTAGSTSFEDASLTIVHEVLHLEGGSLEGIGDIFASVEASGSGAMAPGSSEGTITIHGDYRQGAPAAYNAELGSPASDLIATSGQARLGGILDVTVTGPPAPNTDYVLLSYFSRVGKFGFASVSGPPPPGFSWTIRYAATEFSLRVQSLLPNDPLRVDLRPAAGGLGNQNGLFEPGEIVAVDPTWLRFVPGSVMGVTGTASNFVGPMGGTYGIVDATADYGTIDPGGPGVNCADVGADNCYTLSVDDPPIRPALHWDTTFDEALSDGSEATYTVHVGESFGDVAPAHPFYRFVETIFHNAVTGGCGGGSYCPDNPVTRAQMAVFLLVSRFGASYLPPDETGAVFTDVPAGSFAAAFIEDLAARSITGGCDVNLYCPNGNATREQMAVFLLRTLEGPTYVPPDCVTPTFDDVPCSSVYARWVNEIALRGITAGCGPGLYCPADPITRGQMAVFLTVTFTLPLNGA